MKTWFAKFRVSTALDRDGTAGARRGNPSAKSSPAELQRFEKSLRNLDQQLKAARPATDTPDTLHRSIMSAVRSAAHEQTTQTQRRPALSWLPAPALALALALVAFVGVWWSVQQTAVHEPRMGSQAASRLTAAASTSLNLSQRVAHEAPAALAPLEQEMALLQRDFKKAAELAMASLP